MSNTPDDIEPIAEDQSEQLVNVDDRLPKWYDDVFDGDGNLAPPASILDDEFL
jgi:hypothetical protein